MLTFSLNVLSTGKTYFSGAAALNPDHFAYGAVSTVGNVSTVGFEDIFKGGDRDYNDFNFSVTSTGTSTPEPAAWALMIAGFGFVGAAMRQRKRVTVSYA